MVMHDVDLLPLNPELSYSFPGYGVIRHISSPEYHPRYKFKQFYRFDWVRQTLIRALAIFPEWRHSKTVSYNCSCCWTVTFPAKWYEYWVIRGLNVQLLDVERVRTKIDYWENLVLLLLYRCIFSYNYTKFIGGVLMLTLKDFKMLNGLSNKYWGWGLEDDEFYLRLRFVSLNLLWSGFSTFQGF